MNNRQKLWAFLLFLFLFTGIVFALVHKTESDRQDREFKEHMANQGINIDHWQAY